MTHSTCKTLQTLFAAAAFLAAPWVGADELRAFPAEVSLATAKDQERFIVMIEREDGVTIDVTQEVSIAVEPEGLVTWNDAHRLQPVADGQGTLHVTHGELKVDVPITVQNAAQAPPISFRNDVEPALMRAGCNTGACHGSAQGKNGFRLSLFGYDPMLDHNFLTRDVRGRRMDVSDPHESLMLEKPLGKVDHEGGTKIEEGGLLYNILYEWIETGARNDYNEAPTLTGIKVLPALAVMEGQGAAQRFAVFATYNDGSTRDVTDLAVLSTEDDQVLGIDGAGIATLKGRGEVYIMARFGSFAEIAQVVGIPAGAQVAWPEDAAPANYIDEFVYTKLKKLRVAPAERCSDPVFVRRAFLDIIGSLPTVEETKAFLEDAAPDKRARLIDALLDRPEFSDLWAMKWAEVLRVRSTNELVPKGMHRYNDWLRHAIQSNMPVNELAYELLTAEGGSFSAPAANFYLVESAPTQMAENVAQVFMGIRIQCAQCHNHPFERWTMDDYYSFAAFFAQVGRKQSSDPRESIVYNRGSGEVNNLRNGQVMAPKFLGGDTPDLQGRDRRVALAEWLTSPENPWFARNFANRIWDQFFGRGIIDPTDDVRVSNPASNPDLLDELGKRLIEYNYDMRQIIRDICTSNTYQLSTQPRDPAVTDVDNFAVAQVRRLPSEILLDAVCAVTNTKVKFAALPLGASAVQVANGNSGNYFLDVFGRPTRESACTCERRNEPTLAQTLHLINGGTVQNAIADGSGRLQARVKEETPTESIIQELYLAAFSRAPEENEMTELAQYVSGSEDRYAALEDVYWSVLNSKEFIFNH